MASTPRRAHSRANDDRFLRVPSAVDPIRRRDAHEERQPLRPNRTHRFDQLERERHAVCEHAAVTVGAMVGERREKLVRQITVCEMQFDHVDAQTNASLRGRDEVVAHFLQTGIVECLRNVRTDVVGERRRGNRRPSAAVLDRPAALPRRQRRSFAAGVRELHADFAVAPSPDEAHRSLHSGFVRIAVEAQAMRRDAPLRAHVGRFEEH